MTKEERERLEKDRKFYESIVEYEPDQIDKKAKDYYELRNKLFESQKVNDQQSTTIGCILLLSLIAIIAVVIFLGTHF
jgi:hypothetical protein